MSKTELTNEDQVRLDVLNLLGMNQGVTVDTTVKGQEKRLKIRSKDGTKCLMFTSGISREIPPLRLKRRLTTV